MDARTWLETITDDQPGTVAKKAGIPRRTIYHQLERGTFPIDSIIKITDAYGANVLDALVEAEFITEDEAALKEVAPDVVAALRLASDEQLTDEVLRRLRIVRNHSLYDTPIDELARRRAPAPPAFDASAGDVGSLPMVADSSPDHPEEDLEDYP